MNIARRLAVLACSAFALLAARPASPAIHVASLKEPRFAPAAETTVVPGREVLGWSGNLRAVIGTPAALEQDSLLKPLLGGVGGVDLDADNRQLARFEGAEAEVNARMFVAVLMLAAALGARP